MRNSIGRQAILRLLIDEVEANGTFPKIYSIDIVAIELQHQDSNWVAVLRSQSRLPAGYADTFCIIAARIAQQHNIISD